MSSNPQQPRKSWAKLYVPITQHWECGRGWREEETSKEPTYRNKVERGEGGKDILAWHPLLASAHMWGGDLSSEDEGRQRMKSSNRGSGTGRQGEWTQ